MFFFAFVPINSLYSKEAEVVIPMTESSAPVAYTQPVPLL
jgi:hypothetical protein